MRFGSLFTGIGGFDLALERAGFECAWQVEIDPKCGRLLASKWPTVERHLDVRTVGPDLTRVDLICGGFPCQDLSVAGQRAGLAGERSGLWFEFHRILEIARPRWCVIENVPGLLSSAGGADFLIIIRGLVELGYGVAWRVLDAQYFGLAQRRRRVFIVGCLGGGGAESVLFEPASVSGDPAPCRAPRERAAFTLGASVRGSGGNAGNAWNTDFIPGPTITSGGGKGIRGGRGDGGDMITPALRVGGREQGAGSSYDNTPLVHGAIRSNMRNNSNPMTEVATLLLGNRGERGDADDAGHLVAAISSKWAKGTGGPAGDEVQNLIAAVGENGRGETLTSDVSRALSGGGGKPGQGYPAALTGVGVRRLTPRECERLQGFPDDWTDGFSDSTRYRMLGNAVAVPVAEWIARRLMEVERVPSG